MFSCVHTARPGAANVWTRRDGEGSVRIGRTAAGRLKGYRNVEKQDDHDGRSIARHQRRLCQCCNHIENRNTSRTGTIHEVSFAESMTPVNLSVRTGDEVRWVNKRSLPVTVEFLDGALANVSCEEGFSQRALSNVRARRQDWTTIQPNASASLCFTTIGTVAYNARMESALAGGQTIESGSVRVGQEP